MVFQLKIKNKSAKDSINKNFRGFKSILSKAKYVAKNVIYVKKWSIGVEEKKFKDDDHRSGSPKKISKLRTIKFLI